MALRLSVARPLGAAVRGAAPRAAARAFSASALRAKDVVAEDPNLPNMRVRRHVELLVICVDS